MRRSRRGRNGQLAMYLLAALLALATVGGCRQRPPDVEREDVLLSPISLAEGEKLRVVATTSIVADAVQQIGGDLIELNILLPPGTDPHSFDPTPQDVAAVADADIVFASGAGLEVFLDSLLESAGEGVAIVEVSEGIELLEFDGGHEEEGEHDDRGHEEEAEEPHDHAGADPHVWFDPRNVVVWSDNIAEALAALDPVNADAYAANAEAHRGDLESLDEWIQEQVSQISPQDRILVSDHATLGYFASRYGFEQIGSVLPGHSSLAEPSARELAELQDLMAEQGVKAVFVGMAANPDLAERVTEDTGTRLVFLFTGALSEPGGPADDYVSFMKYNVGAIVDALK